MPVIETNNLFEDQFKKGARTRRPLPPPGRPYDGRMSEPGSALFAAKSQTTVITLGGSTIAGDKTTITITPKLLATGSAWSQHLVPISVTFVSTDTSLTTVAAGLVAALAAAQTISNMADLANYQRVRDVVIPSSNGAAITLVAKDAGLTFEVEVVSLLANDDPGTVTASVATENLTPGRLHIGTVGFRGSITASGDLEIVNASPTSTSADILGVVEDGIGKAAQDAGYLLEHFGEGAEVPFTRYGTRTAYAEGAVTAGGKVYVRRIAAAGQILNAVSGSATISAVEIVTVTPTASNNELFRLDITVINEVTGEIAGSGYIEMTSDGDATPAEIVAGLKTSLDGAQASAIAPFITDTGTDTLILTQASGYSLTISTANSVGVFASVDVTQAAVVEHVLYPGAEFLQSIAAAGSAPISIAHP